MSGNDDDERDRGRECKATTSNTKAPPANGTPPVVGEDNRDQPTSCEQSNSKSNSDESRPGSPKPDNSHASTRSMAAPPKTARVCPSDAPRQTHMGATSPPAPPAPHSPLPSSTSAMQQLQSPSENPQNIPAPTRATTPPSTSPTPPRPSALLPLLRCALCRLLVEAPTTLNCGHTLCSKHMIPGEDEQPGPSSPAQKPCPVEGCRPRQPARVQVLGRTGDLEPRTGVTFTPAHSAPSGPPPTQSPLRGRVVKLDVTVSKLLEVITNAARQSAASVGTSPTERHRDDSPTTDDETTAPIAARPPLTHTRSSPPDPTVDDSRSDRSSQSPPRPHPSNTLSFEKELLSELTCEICFMLLCNPITTPCQHTFCSTCLERSLDHSPKCPLCRLDLPPNSYFYQHAHNEVIVQIVAKAFPKLLEERASIAETDGRDSRLDTPIFVCQLSYPGMPTLLHFFEPRYRLMLRRCLASATPRFGMVMPRQNANNTDGNDYGTMLEIKNVQMLSDGRSMVETYGTFRFRILERGTLDGYLVGRIERIDDYPPEVEAEIERIALMNPSEGDAALRGIERSNQELVDVCRRFLDQLRNGTAPWVVQRLNNTYGPMPTDVASFSFWVALVLPIDEQEKAKLLPIRSPRMRLRLVVHWIEQLNNNWWFSSGCVVG
ncbi:hypothetical protein RSOLAG1IB_03472 [Rhizoctonia solani AG-1 IB]|uniref:LON domain-containing protein n=1 Tax=Thanatephorus cucumeris (strain AG1-IB / isolate 7/3/14) TaxID=1108050 RepID=A0A0B7FRM4_THACB|nr:hypothetical protein RSOLAG1IB_03472 [Rhizoctonia solani AG-1 IB]